MPKKVEIKFLKKYSNNIKYYYYVYDYDLFDENGIYIALNRYV